MDAPEQLRITWATGKAFLAAFDREGPGRYRVAMPGRAPVLPHNQAVGRRIAVELEFLDTMRTFRHLARVASHVDGPPELITFEFLPEEAEIRDLIELHASGDTVPYLHRRDARRPVWIQVAVKVGRRWRRGFVNQLSELGMFIVMRDPPASPSAVLIRLRTEAGVLDLTGRVVYARGMDEATGFAVELVFPTRADEVRIRAALRASLQPANRL